VLSNKYSCSVIFYVAVSLLICGFPSNASEMVKRILLLHIVILMKNFRTASPVDSNREQFEIFCLLCVVCSTRLLTKRKQTQLEPLEDLDRPAKRRKTDQVCNVSMINRKLFRPTE